jgi:hypothetical protein
MNWEFNLGWFFLGLLVLIAGGLIVLLYKPISDNLAHGINSYEHVKLAGIITAIVGCLIMANLHTALLTLLVNAVFKRN